MSRPDFIIIGAMKCATSTLHDQLAAQPGFFMSDPKEPCCFSDDEVYGRGRDGYASLFAAAKPGDLCGESSTHYTKLPTYPRTVDRMAAALPDVKLIYVVRHPIDRLVSHYIHEWTERTIDEPIDEAVRHHPRLVEYSRFAMQLEPYFQTFGRERVLPLFQERLRDHGQEELERVCEFLGYEQQPTWRADRAESNVSAQRLRKSPWRDRLMNVPGFQAIRRTIVPRSVRDRIKKLWMMDRRPELGSQTLAELRERFDADLSQLGHWLGVELTCENFKATVSRRPLNWAAQTTQAIS